MLIYSDQERELIARREYDELRIAQPVGIESNESKLIGYVSEVKGKLSGENTYIVIDA